MAPVGKLRRTRVFGIGDENGLTSFSRQKRLPISTEQIHLCGAFFVDISLSIFAFSIFALSILALVDFCSD